MHGTSLGRAGPALSKEVPCVSPSAVVVGILALEDGLKQGFENIRLHADSELLVKQVNGIYRVKNPRIKELYTQLMALARKFKSFEAKHVRREFNADADLEANRAIDAQNQA